MLLRQHGEVVSLDLARALLYHRLHVPGSTFKFHLLLSLPFFFLLFVLLAFFFFSLFFFFFRFLLSYSLNH